MMPADLLLRAPRPRRYAHYKHEQEAKLKGGHH